MLPHRAMPIDHRRFLKSHLLHLVCTALLIGGALSAGCEVVNTSEEDADLDETLVALLTRDGQRTLSNFILPDSDDFASIPQDPRNPLTTDKVALGKLLFHETALGTQARHEEGRGTYACATCHHAGAGFQAGRKQGIGDGGLGWGGNGEGRIRNPAYETSELDVQALRTPSALNSAYQQAMLWSGALGANWPNDNTQTLWKPGTSQELNTLGFDGLETQAIAALMLHRMDNPASSIITSHPTYRTLWDRVFPGRSVGMSCRSGLPLPRTNAPCSQTGRRSNDG